MKMKLLYCLNYYVIVGVLALFVQSAENSALCSLWGRTTDLREAFITASTDKSHQDLLDHYRKNDHKQLETKVQAQWCEHPHQPFGVRTALGDSAGHTMVIMWSTAAAYESRNDVATVIVTYNDSVPRSFTGSSFGYTVPPKWWDPSGSGGSIQHLVTVTLDPTQSTEFSYQVGASNQSSTHTILPGTESEIFPYRKPLKSSFDAPTNMVLWGDQGSVQLFGFLVAKRLKELFDHNGTQVTGANLAPLRPDALHLIGDIAYAGIAINVPWLNITSSDEYEPFWDLYQAMMEPITARYPFMVTVGNHDMFYNATAFRHRFQMPSTGNGNFWYSYTMGNIRMISLSTEQPYTPGSEQYIWARAALQEAKAARENKEVAWIVVVAHRPMYSSDASEWSEHSPGAPWQRSIEPLLVENGVDLMMSGHMHCYERINPVINGSVVTRPVRGSDGSDEYVNPQAPVHIVIGTGGAIQHETWIQPQPSWSAIRAANQLFGTYGFGILQSSNSTYLHFSFNSVDASDGFTDDFSIAKL